ncbi:MAG: hypothetical protein NZ602_07610 [Thermoguttaceae bacterium]|nr:hypothetical protein [Thermoguttaceae bacterium]MDW8038275.1 hypothetical protein [Thermoguttaceae bacterium]
MWTSARKAEVSLITPIFDVCLTMTIITLSPGVLQYVQWEQMRHGAEEPGLTQQDIERLRTQYQELWRRYEDLLVQLRQKASPEEQAPVDIHRLQAAQQDLHNQIEALWQEIERLRQLLEKSRPADAQTQKRREELQRLLEELQREIVQAEEQLKRLCYTKEQLEKINQLKKAIEQLRRQLDEAQKKGGALNEQIARLEAKLRENALVIKVHPRARHPEGMQPYGVIVHQGTLTPIKPPYYEGFRILGGKILIRFVRSGPSASDAFQPGSEFLQWINSIDPKKEYVVFLVAPDSFDTFRVAREELRKRNIACGWEPHEEGNGNVLIDPDSKPSDNEGPVIQ